jgi:hypothetical protein
MWKQIGVSVALAILIGSSAGASILVQDQGFVIGIGNGIDLIQGNGNSGSSQSLILNLTQNGTGVGSAFGSQLVSVVNMPMITSGLPTMTGIANGLLASGLASPWTVHSLGDQARLHALMLQGN